MLTEKDGKLYGRGSTDDKGPVLDWINAIEAYKELGQEMPVNLKVNQGFFSTPPTRLHLLMATILSSFASKVWKSLARKILTLNWPNERTPF